MMTARAEDWTTTDGKTYKNVTVIKHDAVTVTILDSDGGASIPISNLPPDIQKRFDYDPAKAHAIIEQQKASEADAAKQRSELSELKKTSKTINAVIVQVLPDGILAELETEQYIMQHVAADSNRKDGFGGGVAPTPAIQPTRLVGTGTIVFISTATKGLTENAQVSYSASVVGTYSYTDTQGASRTVQKLIAISGNLANQ